MESDKELLELAAKAVGIGLTPIEVKNVTELGDDRFIGFLADQEQWEGGWFSPLTNNGDALRLAVELNITVVGVISISNEDFAVAEYCHNEFVERITNCKMTAIRRAIVRAAAEIGKAMP